MTSDYVVISFSGGKDSTAMLLRMIDLNEKIDEVLTVDTGYEFPAMYLHIQSVRKIVEEHGIKFTQLRADKTLDYYLIEHPYESKKYGPMKGYGWPGPHIRWCTKFLKTNVMKEYLSDLASQYNLIQCVGLAADEVTRANRVSNKGQRHPLIEWGWTETDCLQYCYNRGFSWGGLYKTFKRVSCWCCPLQPLSELKKLYRFYPDLWSRLLDLDSKVSCTRPFKYTYSVSDLGKRFAREIRAADSQTNIDTWCFMGAAE